MLQFVYKCHKSLPFSYSFSCHGSCQHFGHLNKVDFSNYRVFIGERADADRVMSEHTFSGCVREVGSNNMQVVSRRYAHALALPMNYNKESGEHCWYLVVSSLRHEQTCKDFASMNQSPCMHDSN